MNMKMSQVFSIRRCLIAQMVLLVVFAIPAMTFGDNLPWPLRVPFCIAGRFTDFQNYLKVPYFHGGTDLVASAGTEVFTPVSGTVEVVKYAIYASRAPLQFVYTRTHILKAAVEEQNLICSQVQSSYNANNLEVTITAENGYRWMFRHLDANKIPQSVIEHVNNGTQLQAGEKIGEILPFGGSVYPEARLYDHLHLEITDADGWYVNPETLMIKLPDTQPPKIKGIWFVQNEACTAFTVDICSSASDPPLVAGDVDIIAEIEDTLDGSGYINTPWLIQTSMARKTATGTELLFPPTDIYRFDKLPIKGDRTQLSTTAYKEHFRVEKSDLGSRGNADLRAFYFVLSNGDVEHAYDPARCVRTTEMADGHYIVNVFATDIAGNKSSSSKEFIIRNKKR